jgi:hypothetical protein
MQLSTLLSVFPAIIDVAVRFSLYPPTLLSSLSIYLPTLLLYCPCTYPFCCQAVICTFTPLSGFSAPTHSAVRILCNQSLCCQDSLHLLTLLSGYSATSHSAVRILCTYSLCCQDTPDNPNSVVRLFPSPTPAAVRWPLYLPRLL